MNRFRFDLNDLLSWVFSLVLTSLLYFLFVTNYIGFDRTYAFIISFSVYFLIYLFWININSKVWKYYFISLFYWVIIVIFGIFANSELTFVYLLPIIACISLAFGIVVAQKGRKAMRRNIGVLISILYVSIYSLYFYPKFVFNKSDARSVQIEKAVNLLIFKENDKIFLLDVNGDTVRFKDFSSTINYFELWFLSCRPCLEKMPSIQKLKNKFSKDERVLFTSIIDGNLDSFEQFKVSAGKYSANFNKYLYAPGESMNLIEKLINTKSYPYELIYYNDILKASHLGFSITERSYYLYNRSKLINSLLSL